MYCLNNTVDRSLLQDAVLQHRNGDGLYAVLDHALRLDLLPVDKACGRTDSSSVRTVLLVRRLAAGAARAAAGELVELVVEILVENAGSTEEIRLCEEVRLERVAVEEVLEQIVRIAEAEALLERKEVVLEVRVTLEVRLVRVVGISERPTVERSSLVVQVALIVGSLLLICVGKVRKIGKC